MKLCTVRDLVASARKGFMKKVRRMPWCQDSPSTYVKSLCNRSTSLNSKVLGTHFYMVKRISIHGHFELKKKSAQRADSLKIEKFMIVKVHISGFGTSLIKNRTSTQINFKLLLFLDCWLGNFTNNLESN